MSALTGSGMAAAAVLALSCMLFVARRRRLATKRRSQRKHGVLDWNRWTGRDGVLRDVTRATGSYECLTPTLVLPQTHSQFPFPLTLTTDPNPNPNPNPNQLPTT